MSSPGRKSHKQTAPVATRTSATTPTATDGIGRREGSIFDTLSMEQPPHYLNRTNRYVEPKMCVRLSFFVTRKVIHNDTRVRSLNYVPSARFLVIICLLASYRLLSTTGMQDARFDSNQRFFALYCVTV